MFSLSELFDESCNTLWVLDALDDFKKFYNNGLVNGLSEKNRVCHDAIDTINTSKLDELNRRVYEFMINEVPLAYRGHIVDPIIFHTGRIQRLFPKYDIKFNNELCMLCNINRHISIILLYMLVIYVNSGGDMIL